MHKPGSLTYTLDKLILLYIYIYIYIYEKERERARERERERETFIILTVEFYQNVEF